MINIIAEDLNTNLNSEINRMSQAKIQNDPSRDLLRNITKNFIDSATFLNQNPFFTFHQKTRNNQLIAT